MSCVFPDFELILCKAKISTRGGRPSGGVLVLVRNTFNMYFKRFYEDFSIGVILVLDETLLGSGKDVAYISVYIPPNKLSVLCG